MARSWDSSPLFELPYPASGWGLLPWLIVSCLFMFSHSLLEALLFSEMETRGEHVCSRREVGETGSSRSREVWLGSITWENIYSQLKTKNENVYKRLKTAILVLILTHYWKNIDSGSFKLYFLISFLDECNKNKRSGCVPTFSCAFFVKWKL